MRESTAHPASHRRIALGASVLAGLVLACAAGPVLVPWDPETIRLDAVRTPPSPAHLLGTDDLGRDILARLLHGGRISLFIGVVAALSGTALGTLVGGVAGLAGGLVEAVLMRLTDALHAIPALPLLMVLAAHLGTGPLTIAVVIGLLSWTETARVVRGEVLRLKELPFVEAARSVGAGPRRILLRHILPNALAPVAVGATLSAGNAIIAESAVSFLGLGVQPPTATWGNMLMDAQASMALAPWLTLAPGLAILVTVLAVNLLGDGLAAAMDPRRRRAGR
jgi:ABC-type dipeptide/oligopeptide/nickel transport system permease subunit